MEFLSLIETIVKSSLFLMHTFILSGILQFNGFITAVAIAESSLLNAKVTTLDRNKNFL